MAAHKINRSSRKGLLEQYAPFGPGFLHRACHAGDVVGSNNNDQVFPPMLGTY